MADILTDIRESYDYDRANWQSILDEGRTDMQFVSGDPWDEDDKAARKGRPTVAPEEMGQYFNQVINALRAHPRGMKFAPQGNGASDEGARFYQNKAREVEYRSHAALAYITAAENAIQRSYGYVRVNTKYATARSPNQDIWVESLPNPDMVLPDTDALRSDLSDATRCTVRVWMGQDTFKRKYPGAEVKSFSGVASEFPGWVSGNRIQVAEAWRQTIRKRILLLATPVASPLPVGVFADEVAKDPARWQVIRELGERDDPIVKMYLTNGIEVLKEFDWAGKYIPIVACFGKVLYIEGDTGMERKILSMTRFGRDPWKSYCYACSQQLEVVAQIPKAPVHVWEGQIRGAVMEKAWADLGSVPRGWISSHHLDENGQPYPSPPARIDYPAGAHLQALEVVKEGFRRAIQSAMGSNFLPTSAQRRNEKSGVALDKMEQAAAAGTYHFVDSYNDMIRQVGVIFEDLCGKVHDYEGDVDVIDDQQKSATIHINGAGKDSISTQGDYVVTVSAGPSNDSEREAAQEFTDTLISQLERIAAVSGPQAAAQVLGRAVRMRNLGPIGDEIADLIAPAPKDGEEPPPPEVMALQQENQQLKQVLQQAAQEQQCKIVEQEGRYAIAQLQSQTTLAKAEADNAVKLAIAGLEAKLDALMQQRELTMVDRDYVADRIHERLMARESHRNAEALAAQGVAGQLEVQRSAPTNGAGA